jgi:serpin B
MTYKSIRVLPIFPLMFGAALLIASCSSTAAGDEIKSDKVRQSPTVSEDDLDRLVAGNNAFAFDLYQQLRSSDRNLFFSPTSISTALAMTYAGARESTEQQMAETLHYDLAQSELHPAFNALDNALSSGDDESEEFQLNIANAIWGQDGYAFLETFLDVLAENYGAGLRTLDFTDEPDARESINNWVSQETEDRIKDLIAPGVLSPDTRLVLTNAIYFKGNWFFQFSEANTHNDQFTLLDGSQVLAPMMTQEEEFSYTEADGYQAISLPYLGTKDISMIVVLPEEGEFLELESSLSPEFLDQVNSDFNQRMVDLTMPKFEFESEFDLGRALESMGMPAAFGGEADFSGMTGSPDLFIDSVVHKAFVLVDEEGTEAAAATAVVMAEMAAPPQDSVTMTIDRPFIFLIRDNESGSILFAGRVLSPEG